MIKKIGQGSYSTVFLCINSDDREQYAMKINYLTPRLEGKKRDVLENDVKVI